MVSHGLLFFACICEVLGYGARLSSHTYPSNVRDPATRLDGTDM